jgi:hypothetical protein
VERLRVIDHVAYEAPAGLEDATRWTFGDEARPEAVTVELEAPAGRATPALEVIAALRESITAVFPFGEILDEGETVLDGRRAWFLAYEVGQADEPVVGMVVVANLAGGDHVKVHVRVGDREELGPRLGPTLASVSLRGGPAPVPAGPGYRREHAGPVALDVPAELQGPRSHLFVDAEDRLRLRVTVRPVGAAAFELEDAIARDAARGELRERQEQAWAWGRWVRYGWRGIEAPEEEQAVVRASLTVTVAEAREGMEAVVREVELHGTAAVGRAAELHAAFDGVLASVRAWPSSSQPESSPGGAEGPSGGGVSS